MTPRPGFGRAQSFIHLVNEKLPPCTKVSPEIFTPDTEAHYEEAAQEAKAVCRRCPIIAECLEWAIASDDRFSVLGGMTPSERRALARKQRRAAA